jgi:hypothetical protein
MRRTLFLNIMHKLSETSPYFSERYDVIGRAGLTALQKCITVVRQLAYGVGILQTGYPYIQVSSLRQVAGRVSTHCHVSYGSGPHLATEVGPAVPRILWLHTSPLG